MSQVGVRFPLVLPTYVGQTVGMGTRLHGLDDEACYRAVASRDRRFDGVFYTAVSSTGIYCRPSCPARTPARVNVSFHPSAASAQLAGYRACKRCLPDATPGSPRWDLAADAAGRAMRLISDGVIDREGVPGLARRLGYTPRHLTRLVTTELGAGPLALARARRAQTARTLIEATAMSFADIAFAAGFASVRQFNQTMHEVYAATPTQLRGRRTPHPSVPGLTGQLHLRLAVRTPYDATGLLAFLAARAVPGIEASGPGSYARTLTLPYGPGLVDVRPDDVLEPGRTALVSASFWLHDLRDTSAAVERVRRLLDADCDPVAVAGTLGADPILAADVAATPGIRVPGHVDGVELAVRAVLGQQVSVAAARTAAHRLTVEYGEALEVPAEAAAPLGLNRLFPDPATLAGVDPERLPMPRSRARALITLCAALAGGELDLDRGGDRDDARRRLLALPGIGPWTADYIAMRALGHPDVLMTTDLGVRQALARRGVADADATTVGEAWRPWRSYAQHYLWRSLGADPTKEQR
jgi:AraC family transcriptional regulator of adaptative response / DNA-3-methyladenine glycosylase II